MSEETNKSKAPHNDFLHGRLLPMIIKFSLPAALSLLISAVYNIVDRMFVGNFIGVSALAGLSVCFPLFNLMIGIGLTCSAGGASLFSLFAGENDQKKMNLAFGNAFVLCIGLELLLMILLLIFKEGILQVFGVTDTNYVYASTYYQIVVFCCLFQGLTMVFCDFVRVSGKPVAGMWVTGVGAITNIVLDALFIIVFGWGVAGAAIATLIGQVVSVIYGLYMVFGGHTRVQISKKIFSLKKEMSFNIISCGFALFITQIATALVTLVYNSQLGKYGGDNAISVYAVVASIMTFVIMPASGISQGIQPILGNNYGGGLYKRVMQTFWLSSIVSVGVTAVIWVLVMLFPSAILLAFGASEEMLSIGIPGLRLNFIITPTIGFVMLATTFFQSLAKPAPSILITLLRQVVLLIPFIYLFPLVWGIEGIFAAQPVSDALALIISLLCILHEQKRLQHMSLDLQHATI